MTFTTVESPYDSEPACSDLKPWSAPRLTVSRTEEAEGNGGGGPDFASEVS